MLLSIGRARHIFIKLRGNINRDGLRGQTGAGGAEERGKSRDGGISKDRESGGK